MREQTEQQKHELELLATVQDEDIDLRDAGSHRLHWL